MYNNQIVFSYFCKRIALYIQILMYNNLEPTEPVEEPQLSYSILMEQSIYSLYRIEIAKRRYVAKVYPPCRLAHYGRELSLLQSMNHPNIIKPLAPDSALNAKLAPIFKTDLIVFPEAARGSLLSYLQTNRALSERVARFYMTKIVSALLYAQKQAGVSHPNLTLGNLLLDEEHNLLICGWSNSLQVKKDVSFALAEIAVALLTGRSPFVCKDLKVDPYGKFLSDKLIHKFWQQSEKFTRKLYKNFVFSEEFKNIIGCMFLGKFNSLEKVSEVYLKQQVISLEEAQKELLEQENSIIERKKEKRILQKKQYLEEQQLVIQTEELALNRQSSRSHEVFLDEYNALKLEEEVELPEKSNSDNRQYFQLFTHDLKIVVAHLRCKISEVQQKQKEEYFVDPLLLLQDDWSAEIEDKEIKIHFPLTWNFGEIESKEGLTAVQINVSLVLARQKESLWGTFGEIDCSTLDTGCSMWVVHWLKEALQLFQ